MKSNPPATPSESKSLPIRDQVIARLKAIHCWPVPPAVIDRLTAKVNAEIATVVQDSIKSFGSVAKVMSEIEKGPDSSASES